MNRNKQKIIARFLLGENVRARYRDKATREITGMDRLIYRESLDSHNIGYFLASDGRQVPLRSIRGTEYFREKDFYFLDLDACSRAREVTLNEVMGALKWD